MARNPIRIHELKKTIAYLVNQSTFTKKKIYLYVGSVAQRSRHETANQKSLGCNVENEWGAGGSSPGGGDVCNGTLLQPCHTENKTERN